MISTSSLGNVQKNWKRNFSNAKNIHFFYLKVATKPFSNKLHMTKFYFKYYWTLCFIFPENGFNFVTQKFAKNWKNAIFKHSDIRFLVQGSYKNTLSHFPLKRFQLCHSKICKNTEKCPFQTLRTFVFELKVTSKPFSKKLPMTKFWYE